MAEARKIIKSNQEQAVASWINYLNQIRLDRLLEALQKEEGNLAAAINTINETFEKIGKEIVYNGKGRGGECGMHGFIAEVAECGVGNAREKIEGKAAIYEWINDNGPEDLRRGATLIQQKFVNSGGHLSLQAIKNHLDTYPKFLDEGGIYQIPEDHYEKIKWLLSISEKDANKMPTSTGDFSMKQWREVHRFFENGNVPLEKIEPSKLTYDNVQRDAYRQTLAAEKDRLKDRNQERRKYAYEKSKPSLAEGAKATAASAAIEGATNLVMAIAAKKKAGKSIHCFDEEDWKDIAGATGKGAAIGGVRGASIYLLTNFTATPAFVANAIVTASFGVAEQAHLFRTGEIDKLTFIENSENLCLDVSISALSSFAGQIMIPVPILGAVIGNSVGTILYQIAKDNLLENEQAILRDYAKSIHDLNADLQEEYQKFLDNLTDDLCVFMDLINRAFAADIRIAFVGSIDLAKECGVPSEEILDCKEKVDSYFLD